MRTTLGNESLMIALMLLELHALGAPMERHTLQWAQFIARVNA